MPIRFNCTCGQEFVVDEARAGQAGSCTRCAQPITVPTLGPAPDGDQVRLPEGEIEFSCSRCGMPFRVPAHMAGRDGACTKCRAPIRVPLPPGVDAPIVFTCLVCGKHFEVAAAMAGQWGYCDACRAPIQVPKKSPEEAPPAVPPPLPPAALMPGPSSGARMRESDHDLQRSTAPPGPTGAAAAVSGFHVPPDTARSGTHVRSLEQDQEPAGAIGVIKFRHTCGKGMAVPSTLAGKAGTCPQCKQRFVVPDPAREEPVVEQSDVIHTHEDVYAHPKAMVAAGEASTEGPAPRPVAPARARNMEPGLKLPGVEDQPPRAWDPLASDPEWDPTASASGDEWGNPTVATGDAVENRAAPPKGPVCQSCGKDVPKFAVRCPHCEEPLGKRKSKRSEAKPGGARSLAIPAAIGAGLLLVVILYSIFRGDGGTDDAEGTLDVSEVAAQILQTWKSQAGAGGLPAEVVADLLEFHQTFLASLQSGEERFVLAIPWKAGGGARGVPERLFGWHERLWKWRASISTSVRGTLESRDAFKNAFGTTFSKLRDQLVAEAEGASEPDKVARGEQALVQRLEKVVTDQPGDLTLIRHAIWTVPRPLAQGSSRPGGALASEAHRALVEAAARDLKEDDLVGRWDHYIAKVEMGGLAFQRFHLTEEGANELKRAFAEVQEAVKGTPKAKLGEASVYVAARSCNLAAFGQMTALPRWAKAGLADDFAFEVQEFYQKPDPQSRRTEPELLLRVLRVQYGPLAWAPELRYIAVYEYGERLYLCPWSPPE